MAGLEAAVKYIGTTPHPNKQYTWIVEAVFADAESPGGGMFTPVTVFKEQKEAEAFVIKLTTACPSVDFLTFRARPMRFFRPFFDTNPTILLTDDDKFNETILRVEANRIAQEAKDLARKDALKEQGTEEVKVGTPAHIARLVHLCAQNQGYIKHHQKEAAAAESSYAARVTELKATLATHPNTEWLSYITRILTNINETSTLDCMKAWWDKNKDELQAV